MAGAPAPAAARLHPAIMPLDRKSSWTCRISPTMPVVEPLLQSAGSRRGSASSRAPSAGPSGRAPPPAPRPRAKVWRQRLLAHDGETLRRRQPDQSAWNSRGAQISTISSSLARASLRLRIAARQYQTASALLIARRLRDRQSPRPGRGRLALPGRQMVLRHPAGADQAPHASHGTHHYDPVHFVNNHARLTQTVVNRQVLHLTAVYSHVLSDVHRQALSAIGVRKFSVIGMQFY